MGLIHGRIQAYVEHSSSVADLLNIIEKRVILMLNRGVRLVVLDSIAALFRVEFGVGDSVQRAKMMFRTITATPS